MRHSPSFSTRPFLRRDLSFAVLLLALGGAGGFSEASLSATRVGRAQTIAVPFTLETESYFYQDDPKGELAARKITARRSDGTTAIVETIFLGKRTERRIRVLKYLDGRKVQLVDAIAVKTTWPRPAAKEAAWNRDRILHPPKDCVFANYETFLRNDKLLGHNVVVVSASYTNTEWRAPDLGCEVIQRRVGYKHERVFKMQSETWPIRLKFGEPDLRLFDESADYAEVKPSELLRRMAAKSGIPWDADLQRQGERADKNFLRNQH